MFCNQCGAKNNEGSKFCKECGKPIIGIYNNPTVPTHDEHDLVDNFKGVLEKYFEFRGRASRREYWMFYVAYMIILMLMILINLVAPWLSVIISLFMLAIAIPAIAVGVRRLHDTGHSGGFMFLSLVPFIGPIILLVLFATEGDSGNNMYGSNPKELLSNAEAKPHKSGESQKVHQLKNMALMLDGACKNGEVADDEVEKAQAVLNSINEKYQDDNDVLGSDAYLIYEVQGLIHWVKGQKKDAMDLIQSARNAKGSQQLFTDSANELRSSLR